ncbi:unnamed protein product [Paramecium primaurelia]|uniref:Transmembrane protein n=1 Tax=Paramecium primaurelia TaxID=5886 RepID=A0A8S1Q0Z2_PARPR|nr:unnamed protein product [Paramecium primaurelia]
MLLFILYPIYAKLQISVLDIKMVIIQQSVYSFKQLIIKNTDEFINQQLTNKLHNQYLQHIKLFIKNNIVYGLISDIISHVYGTPYSQPGGAFPIQSIVIGSFIDVFLSLNHVCFDGGYVKRTQFLQLQDQIFQKIMILLFHVMGVLLILKYI